MKHTKRHQCKCHLKSESAFINSTATKRSAVSYISSCFVCVTENVRIAVLRRDLLINRSWLVTWQSAKHTALLAMGLPQNATQHSKCCPLFAFLSPRVCISTTALHHARHGWWLYSCAADARLTCFIAVPALWFQEWVFRCFRSPALLSGITVARHKVLVGRRWPGSHPGVWWGSLLRLWVTRGGLQLHLLHEPFVRRLQMPRFVTIRYLIISASSVLHGVSHTRAKLLHTNEFSTVATVSGMAVPPDIIAAYLHMSL